MSTFDQAAERARVEAVIQLYFDGLFHSDTARLRRVFHPQALYASAGGGQLVLLSMEEYFPVVDRRASPASLGQARHDRIVRVEFAGPHTALALVECRIHPKHFMDVLTFVLLEGRWQLISKVFDFELIDE